MITFRVNGTAHTLDVHADESALEVLRNRLHLTGTKEVCGSGVCGACTVLLDTEPVCSCLLPAHALHERSLTTIEGLSSELHPVQRAFIACDALQCGFCTPGYILESVAFYEDWQAEHPNETPAREEITARLSGHLCRCGAYPGIIAALQQACTNGPDQQTCCDPRYDAYEKVTGKTLYTSDVWSDGQLEGVILRSPHAHARIISIDTSQATALPGVKAIVELLAKDRTVHYQGQEILALAAVDRRTALRALQLIDVQYALQAATLNIAATCKPQAARVYHWPYSKAPNVGESPLLPTRWRGNIRGPFTMMSRKPAQAKRRLEYARRTYQERNAEENVLVEGQWETQAVSHTPFETHACVAHWPTSDTLIVHLSTQACARMAREIAQRWKLPVSHVQVLSDAIGGAFGAKLELTAEAVAAIELGAQTRVPVRVILDRAEEMCIGGHRPAVTVDVSLLGDKQGSLEALEVKARGDTGIGIGSFVANLCQNIYPGAPRHLADYDLVTHTPPGKPFRGPGGPAAFWALEQAVDEMAERYGEDPLHLRQGWNPSPALQALYTWVESLPAWQNRARWAEQVGPVRRGIGLAVGNWPYFLQPRTQVELIVMSDGLHVKTASQDMGNGTKTVLARTIAQAFTLPQQSIAVHIGNSQAVIGPSSSGSRTTASLMSAIQDAIQQMRAYLLQIARDYLHDPHANATSQGVIHTQGLLPWSEIFALAPQHTVIGKREKDQRRYQLPVAIRDLQIGAGSVWGVQVSEVEVDLRYGLIRVPRVWGGFASGRIVAPMLARSQVHGGIIQGLGYALYEERVNDPLTGRLLNTQLSDYTLPGIGDTPEIEVYFHEEGFDYVPGGSVGLAEITTIAVAASIGNAVHHATGWRPRHLPLRPDRVLAGIREIGL
jgi:xanthine dehydrogenase YagR molybdenum-binding subunit